MRSWFSRHKKSRPAADTAPPDAGWLRPESAESLLSTPLRQRLLHTLWQRTALPRSLFDELYQQPVSRFAQLVQQLPASESHHHAYPGGILDHTLEVMAFAAQMRQSHLLPPDSPPEDQAREAEAWTAVVIYAALLHDCGKIVTDMDIVTDDGQRWYPWQGALTRPYHLKFRVSRDYHLHPVAGSLLCQQILPAAALSWLAQYPALFSTLLYCISGHYDKAGVPGELVQNADRSSVAQNLGGDAHRALARPRTSLAGQITTAVRELVRTSFTLNNTASGSDGWFTGDALWLISKTSADKIRAWLLQHGIAGIPDSNSRLFDEMQGCGLIVPTPDDKAVWHCDIAAHGGWTPGTPLTLLRFAPALVWPDTGNRPAVFAGTVTPASKTLAPETPALPAATTTPVHENSSEEPDAFAYSPFCDPGSPQQATTMNKVLRAENISQGAATEDNPAPTRDHTVALNTSLSARGFVDWLRQALAEHRLVVNDTLARVHMVEGAAFLVSPEIFKLYIKSTTGETGDEWRRLQKEFQKLKLHRRGDDGINIWTIEVRGPRKVRKVKGFLLDNPQEIFGQTVPEDNPYLSVMLPRH